MEDLIKIISGGAFGTIITIMYNRFQNKKQNIRYEVMISTIFHPNSDLKNKVCLNIYNEQGNSLHDYFNLFHVILKIKNISNKDFLSFEFGVNITDGKEIINIEDISIDRKHEILINPKISYENTKNEVDITLDPFNRKEEYVFKFLIATITNAKEESLSIFKEESFKISTKQPVIFTKIDNREVVVNFGNKLLLYSSILLATTLVIMTIWQSLDINNLQKDLIHKKAQSIDKLMEVYENSKLELDILQNANKKREKEIDSLKILLNNLKNK